MVGRQILLGVSGGGLLAALALFLTTPREAVEEAIPLLREQSSASEARLPEPDLSRVELEADAAPEVRVAGFGLVGASKGASSDARVDVDSDGPFGNDVDTPERPEESPASAERVDGSDAAGENEHRSPTHNPYADPEELHPETFIAALSKQTVIRSKPDHSSPILGFARTGTLLRRALTPAGKRGCSGGWYRVEPKGYICVGKAATLDTTHPIAQLASMQPDRSLPLPYIYGRSRYPTPPLYTRIPTQEQQEIAEADLRGHLRKNFDALWAEEADTPPPSLLADGQRVPRPYGYPRLDHDFMTGRALGNSAFAFIDLFETETRSYGLTTDLSLIPLDRVTQVETSEFAGLILGPHSRLPVAFVRSSKQHVYRGDPQNGSLRPERSIQYREAFSLTGKRVQLFGSTFLETTEGDYIKESPLVVVVEPPEKLPRWAVGDRSWIEVSILKQTLVAYRGEQPVFVTLVSTGKDGLGDPTETHSTPQGVFLVHTKHVTATMSGDNADDEFDLRDVPYVQYFHEGFALHAAFWHDSFGTPRSHGCVNLSPADARHLFTWTDPPVPLRWHSALSREGTLIWVHP